MEYREAFMEYQEARMEYQIALIEWQEALKLKIDRDTVGYDFKVVAYKKVQSCMGDE